MQTIYIYTNFHKKIGMQQAYTVDKYCFLFTLYIGLRHYVITHVQLVCNQLGSGEGYKLAGACVCSSAARSTFGALGAGRLSRPVWGSGPSAV
jgi:hypothetical protein